MARRRRVISLRVFLEERPTVNNDKRAAAAPQENKMGVMPVKKLLLNMSLPMMASMLVQALYNIVDSIYVSRISENALTAVSLAFPIQNLMIAVGTGTGVGVSALLSRALGEKNQKEANRLGEHGCFLAVLSYLLFLVIGLCGSRVFFADMIGMVSSCWFWN